MNTYYSNLGKKLSNRITIPNNINMQLPNKNRLFKIKKKRHGQNTCKDFKNHLIFYTRRFTTQL